MDTYINNLEEKLNYSNEEFSSILNNYGVSDLKEFFKVKTTLDEKMMKLGEIETLKEKAAELINNINLYLKKASSLIGIDMRIDIGGMKEDGKEIKELTMKIEEFKEKNKKFTEEIDDAGLKRDCLINELSMRSEELLINSLNYDNGLYRDLGKDLDSDSIKEIEKDLEIFCEKVREEENSLALKLKEYETIINTSGYDDEQLQKTIEEIDELETERKKLEDIQFSLSKALEILTEASLELQRDYIPALDGKMGYYISKITNGKYSDLRVDNKLILKTQEPEISNIVPVIQLSGGTIDQMYLALRFAMSDLISQKEESLPLIMDEAFAQFDDMRIEESMKLLDSISKSRQIIMFTCKNREVDIAREICSDINIINLK